MTRQVHPGSMVAHLWANASQDSARTNNGNFYFTGPRLYSYGSHFVVGLHLPFDGPTLLNADSYSISTSGHQSDARRAVSGRPIYVARLTELADNLNYRDRTKADSANAVFRHCVDLLERGISIDDDSLKSLLAYAGRAKSFDKIKREAARKIAAGQARALRDKKAEALQSLKNWQAMESTLYARALADCVRASAYETTAAILERYSTQIRKAQRTLGKAGTPPRVWQASQRILKALAVMVPSLNAARGPATHRAQLRERITGLRRDITGVQNLWAEASQYRDSGRLNQLSSRLYNLSQRLGGLARFESRYLPASTQARALSLVDVVDSVQYSVAEQSRLLQMAERVERERLAARTQAESRADFFAGRPSNWHGSTESGSCYIRAIDIRRNAEGRIDGGELQTSHGARVPLVHAIRAFRFVKLIRENTPKHDSTHYIGNPNPFDAPIAWRRNGERVRVGSFELDSITINGDFVAGCHKIAWPQIEELARALGVFDLPASREAASHA